MQLKKQKRMEINFVQCPPVANWKTVYLEYRDWYAQTVVHRHQILSPEFSLKPLPQFCSLAMKYRANDTEFNRLHQTLQSIHNAIL